MMEDSLARNSGSKLSRSNCCGFGVLTVQFLQCTIPVPGPLSRHSCNLDRIPEPGKIMAYLLTRCTTNRRPLLSVAHSRCPTSPTILPARRRRLSRSVNQRMGHSSIPVNRYMPCHPKCRLSKLHTPATLSSNNLECKYHSSNSSQQCHPNKCCSLRCSLNRCNIRRTKCNPLSNLFSRSHWRRPSNNNLSHRILIRSKLWRLSRNRNLKDSSSSQQ